MPLIALCWENFQAIALEIHTKHLKRLYSFYLISSNDRISTSIKCSICCQFQLSCETKKLISYELNLGFSFRLIIGLWMHAQAHTVWKRNLASSVFIFYIMFNDKPTHPCALCRKGSRQHRSKLSWKQWCALFKELMFVKLKVKQLA